MTELKAEVTISRMIDAPVDLVFRAWTEGAHLAKWYAPEGFGVAKAEADAKQGGVFTIVMQGPDGAEYPLWGTYTEFDRPTKLIMSATAAGADGTPALDAVTTVTLVDHDGKTELTVHEKASALTPEAAPMLAGMEAGLLQSLRRLDDVVTGAVDRSIVLEQDAPGTSRAGVRAVDLAGAPGQLVGTERLHAHDPRSRHPSGRRLEVHDARTRRRRLPERPQVRRDPRSRAHLVRAREPERGRPGVPRRHHVRRLPGDDGPDDAVGLRDDRAAAARRRQVRRDRGRQPDPGPPGRVRRGGHQGAARRAVDPAARRGCPRGALAGSSVWSGGPTRARPPAPACAGRRTGSRRSCPPSVVPCSVATSTVVPGSASPIGTHA